jgi:hypothetical protein
VNESIDNVKSDLDSADLGRRIYRALKSAPEVAIVNVLSSLAEARDVGALRAAIEAGLLDGVTSPRARSILACQVAPILTNADLDTERFVTEWLFHLQMEDPDAIGSCLMLLGAEHQEVALKLLNANPLAIACQTDGQPDAQGRNSLQLAFEKRSQEAVCAMLAHLAAHDRLPVVDYNPDGTPVSCFQKMIWLHNTADELRVVLPVLAHLVASGVPDSWSRDIGRILHEAACRPTILFFDGQTRRTLESGLMCLATMDDPQHWRDVIASCRNHDIAGWLSADEVKAPTVLKNMVRDGVVLDEIDAGMTSFGECTLLHKAVEVNNPATVAFLLENGANPNAMTRRRDTHGNLTEKQWDAIGMAQRNGHTHLVQMIQAWQAQQVVIAVAGAARAAMPT